MQVAEQREFEARLQAMSEAELLIVQLRLMDLILAKKMDENKIVFSGVESSLLN